MQFQNVNEEALWCQVVIAALRFSDHGAGLKNACDFGDYAVTEYRQRVPDGGYGVGCLMPEAPPA